MPMLFSVLASGSRGNAVVVRTETAGVLLDLGLGPRGAGEADDSGRRIVE